MPYVRFAALVLIALTAAVGCDAVGHVATSLNPTASGDSGLTQARDYPANAEVGRPLIVEVVRVNRKQIRLENRSPQVIEGAQLWLNQEYGGAIEPIGVGERRTIALNQFVNHYGEHFPIGSLLEPEKTDTIVLGDLLINGKLHKLVVRLPDDWQDARPLGA